MTQYRLPIIMQAQLLCRNPQRKYLFRPASADKHKWELPLFLIADEQKSLHVISSHFQQKGVDVDVKGIVSIEIGAESDLHNFMRVVYFGLTAAKQPSGWTYRSIAEVQDNPSDISQSEMKILRQVDAAKHVYSLSLFRQGFAEKEPKSASEQILISIE